MPKLKDVETWFIKALDIPETERRSYLETHLQNEPDLLHEVMELVQNEHEGLLTQLKEDLIRETGEIPIPEIDRYKLEEEIGKGGMAVVYRGNRTDGVFDHEVAVKVLLPDMNSDDFVQRFNQERNVLGRLKHENIAQIYDGGVTSDGRPYFVMEYVSGKNILTYAKEENLTLRERLTLFLKVCGAVRFAHQNLVIHRDIKPANIFVNERGEVKLMDFGISQLMDFESVSDGGLKEKTLFTPGYASPEQLERTQVDIRTDVYQLGKVLKALFQDIWGPKELKLLVLHAIRKDKNSRYQSVGEFITDINNFLNNQPLGIRKRSWGYVARKFVQRNQLMVLAITLIVGVLVVSTSLYIQKINQSNARISFEKDIAESSVNLFLKIFSNAYPSYAKGDTLNVFQLLDIGDSLLTFSSSNFLNGRFSQLIGEIYAGYNQEQEAIPYYRKAIKYLESDSVSIKESRNMLFAAQAALAGIYITIGKNDSAYYYLRESERYALMNGLEAAYEPSLYGRLAWLEVNRGNYERADTLYQKAIDIFAEREPGIMMLNQMAYYGRFLNYYDTPGRKKQIDSLYQAAKIVFEMKGLDTTRRNDYARLINYMGLFNLDIQSYENAAAYFQQAFEINNQLFGLKNLATLDNLNNLGQILLLQEKYMEARGKFLTCWEAASALNIPSRSSLVYYHNYASTFNLLKEYEPGMMKFDSLISALETGAVFDLVRINNARLELSRSHVGLENYSAGQEVLNQVIRTHQESFGEKGTADIQAGIELVKLFTKKGDEEQAKIQFDSNLKQILARLGAESNLIAVNEKALGELAPEVLTDR